MEQYDVVVVGAGVCGLSAAHTFLTIDPDLSLLVVDPKSTIGGVWSKEQLYPGLRTNSVQGYFEFSDYPVLAADVGVKRRAHISGNQMHAYLENFAKHFDLNRHIRLCTEIIRAREDGAENGDAGWTLDCESSNPGDGESMSTIRCKKLFKGPVVHTFDLGRAAPGIVDDENVKNVVVIGGAKSAHDAVYIFASAGKHVDWILPSRGAVPMAKPSSKLGSWTIFVEAVLMFRPITWLGPAPWSVGDGFGWIRRFLHGTSLGNRLVKGYWETTGGQALQESGIMDNQKAQVLLPRDTPMFYGTQVSALNYDTNFYDLLNENKVSVATGKIDYIDGSRIHMDSGDVLNTDAIILATGYNHSTGIPLEPASKNLSRGCPIDLSEHQDNIYPDLDAKSDRQIVSQFPLMLHAPSKPERTPSLTPWRLWRFLAPPSQINNSAKGRNLVFLNAVASFQTVIKCEVTSLWAYAYLHDRLAIPTPTESDARREISLWTRFGKFRAALGMQGKQADLLLDGLPYYDLLLRDLGLRSWRKGWGWIGEVFWGAYSAQDYRGIVGEWMAMQKGLGGKEKTL
ncbi:hypothetical protein BDY17DRAFT_352592 [Neohortaea acidophila]|uniref:FAD/NAD(P)-binding domain-containing protein n=1 Tax=Neohortaea acidophila TaxID=245834 RepID=A0A6A6PWD2_9PEZI|nr:uncharacterized protein BDY17DRAFT_352592 [Neohortaea acidophila]KAF2483979.1 hypothetical protein BDY17DRAFT_352592 [Neohortaea acidophila]